jgi:DNA modification methylase
MAKKKIKPPAAGIRDRIKELRRVRAGDLHANPHNWRTHPQGQVDALRGVLAEIGYADALLVRELPDGSLELIDGHCRKELDPEQIVPVLVLDLDQDEALKLMTILDPLAAMAEANEEALKSLLSDIETNSEALQKMLNGLAKEHGIALEQEPLVDAEPQIDRAAELQKEWGTAAGQIWEVVGKAGTHRVMCGDLTKAEDVGRLMRGMVANLIVTDPPYGVNYEGGQHNKKKRAGIQGDGSTDLYPWACRRSAQFSDDNAALYLWHAGVKGIAAAAAAAAAAAGYEIRNELIWHKTKAHYGAFAAQYMQKHEPLYYCHKRGKAPRWFGPTNEVTVWDCDQPTRNENHPTEKPVSLFARAIKNSSEPTHVVCDWFLGSGTTLIAAEQLGRICYGMEISPAYVAVILQRCKDAGMKPKLAGV